MGDDSDSVRISFIYLRTLKSSYVLFLDQVMLLQNLPGIVFLLSPGLRTFIGTEGEFEETTIFNKVCPACLGLIV